MLAVWPFWVVLAVFFGALAYFTRRHRIDLAGEYVKWAVWTGSPQTAAGLGKAIDTILWIEIFGFVGAAAAALLSLFA